MFVRRKALKNLDVPFCLALVALLVAGIFILASASWTYAEDPLFYVKKHLLWIACGLVCFVAVTLVDYKHLQRYGWHLYGLALIILAGVLFLGTESRGAKSWINLGPFLFQPSEFSKVIMIVSFADFLNRRPDSIRTLKGIACCLAFFALPTGLIVAQPDMGTAIVFVAIAFGMMFVAGGNERILITMLAGGLLSLIALLWAHFHWGLPVPLEEYQVRRLTVFLNPYNDGLGGRGAGYHLIQSMVAIGSGGMLGKGWRQGSQVQLNFLPEHHTDFIFSVAGEEFGFLGALALLLSYFILIYRLVNMAYRARDSFGCLIIVGVASKLAFHVLVNVGMAIGIMPITGIPLPLLSYGGSSMVSTLIALGLALNVDLRRQKVLF